VVIPTSQRDRFADAIVTCKSVPRYPLACVG